MSFKFVYEQAVSQSGFLRDAEHAEAVEHLDRLYREFADNCSKKKSFLSRLFSAKVHSRHKNYPTHGCYIWGNVGRGKTWLMDLFFQALPDGSKMRLHFTDFMQHVHNKLTLYSGLRNPLQYVADNLAQNAQILCLDEFHVDDIADAMLLYGLLEALYRRGIILVMTSNAKPDNLYWNGLQRERFLPAIELIKKANTILHVTGDYDFRKSSCIPVSNYLFPLSNDTDLILEQRFHALVNGPVTRKDTLKINDRPIKAKMYGKNTVWFEFAALCEGPRAAIDYIQLADQFDNMIVSNVYRMTEVNEDIAKRFILLVDTLYDRHIHVIISATANPENLYEGRLFIKEFKRTASRLEEIARREISISTHTVGSKLSSAK